MLRRLLGLLLIIRAFTPLIAVGVVVWGLGEMVADVRGPLVRRANVIDAELDTLAETLDTALGQFAAVKADLGGVLEQLAAVNLDVTLPELPDDLSLPGVTIPDPVLAVPSGVAITWEDFSYEVQEWIPNDCGIFDFVCDATELVLTTITRILRYPTGISVHTASFRLNTPDIPALHVALPGLVYELETGVQSALDGMFGVFRLAGDMLATVIALGDGLEALPTHAAQITAGGQAVVDAGLGVLRQWRNVLVPAGIGLALLIGYAFIAQLIGNVTRGWRLLFGPAPVKPVANSAAGSPRSANR